MISTKVFCPYERLLAKALDYFENEVKLIGAKIRLIFEDGYATPTYTVGQTPGVDINLGRSEAMRRKLLSAQYFKATLEITNQEKLEYRYITVKNSLKTDQLPFMYATIDGVKKYNATNAAGERFFYPEPYFTENARCELVGLKEGVDTMQEPLLVRPVYQYTEPLISGDQWTIYGPDPLLFNYKRYSVLKCWDSSEGKSAQRSYNLLEKYGVDPGPDPVVNPTNGAKMLRYFISDGSLLRQFNLCHGLYGIEGSAIPGEEVAKMVRIWCEFERKGRTDAIASLLNITFDENLYGYILAVDVTDNRTYVNQDASAYDSKYLRRDEDILSLTRHFIPFGMALGYVWDEAKGRVFKLTSDESLAGTTATCATEMITRGILSMGYEVRVWLAVCDALVESGFIQFIEATKDTPAAYFKADFSNNHDPFVVSTPIAEYKLQIKSHELEEKHYKDLKQDGMYLVGCSKLDGNGKPEYYILFYKEGDSAFVVLDPRKGGLNFGDPLDTLLEEQGYMSKGEFTMRGFTYRVDKGSQKLAESESAGAFIV